MTIPAWVIESVKNRSIATFTNIIASSKDIAEKNYALFGKAECLRLGGKDFPADIKEAYALYQSLDNDQTPTELRERAIAGKAECLRLGGKDFPADVKQAYALYQSLDNDQTPTELRQRVIFGKAECLRLGVKDFPADIKEAYALYQSLDNDQTSTELRQWVIFCKAVCLRLGGKDFPADVKQAYALYQSLDNDQTSTELRQWVIFGKAECLRLGGKDFPADVKQAYALYQPLDNDQTPTELRQRVIFGKAECLRLGGKDFPADVKQAVTLLDKLLSTNNLTDSVRVMFLKYKKYCEDKLKKNQQGITKIQLDELAQAQANVQRLESELAQAKNLYDKLKTENDEFNRKQQIQIQPPLGTHVSSGTVAATIAPPPAPPTVTQLNPPSRPTVVKGIATSNKRKNPEIPSVTEKSIRNFIHASQLSGILMLSPPKTTGAMPVSINQEEEPEVEITRQKNDRTEERAGVRSR